MPSRSDARKPLGFFLALRYPVRLTPEAEGGFTAEVPDLPGCLSQGETAEEALLRIQEARTLWIEVAYECGDPIPLPSSEEPYSGKVLLRMPVSLHRRLAEGAAREKVSLNQYLVHLLSDQNAQREIQARIEGLCDASQRTHATVEEFLSAMEWRPAAGAGSLMEASAWKKPRLTLVASEGG